MTRLTYKLGPRIGAGASGVVYRATLSDGRTVAVKRLTPGKSVVKQSREGIHLARLNHPNIVQFYALQPSPERPDQNDLITALVPGLTLAQLCRRGRLPVNIALYIVREVLAALDHVHQTARLVHSDLSPRNILISHDGQVKVADFGLAKAAGASRTTTLLRGSPPYVSPEQLGPDELDARSDLFVLGIHLYYLLTGHLPFHDDGLADIEERRLIVPPIALRPELPRALDTITRKLLDYDRNRRYSSAAVLMEDLPEATTGQIDLADYMRQQAQQRPHRPSRWLLASLAAAALLGATALYTLQALAATAQPHDAPTQCPPPATPLSADTTTPRALNELHPATAVDPQITSALTPRKKSSTSIQTLAFQPRSSVQPATTRNAAAASTPPQSQSADTGEQDPPPSDHAKLYGPTGSGVYYPGGRKEVE